jgi:O-antigen ligase
MAVLVSRWDFFYGHHRPVAVHLWAIMLVSRIHYGHVLGAAAVLAPILGLFAPLMVAPLAVAVIIATVGVDLWRKPAMPPLDWPFLAPYLLLFIWSALSIIWSVDGADAAKKWSALAAAGLPCAYLLLRTQTLIEVERRIIRRSVCIGALLGLSLALVEVVTKGFILVDLFGLVSPNGNYTGLINRAPAVLLLFAWLAAAAAPKRGWALVVAGAIMAYALPSESALVAYGIAVLVYIGVIAAPCIMRFLLPIAMAGTLLLAPMLFSAIDKPVRQIMGDGNSSIIHRLEIWDFTIQLIKENPWTGLGFNGSRHAPGGAERYILRNKAGQMIGQGDRLPLHPHNGAMQIWLELGFPGALLIATLAALTGYRATSLPGRQAPAMAAGLVTTAFLIWLLSYGVWQSWWVSTFVLVGLLAAPSRRLNVGEGEGSDEKAAQ